MSPSEADIRYFDALESRLTAQVSERMLELTGLAPGMTVLDLACGRGEPSLRAASRVGVTGRVVGVDVSLESLVAVREKALAAGLSNVEFRHQDAKDIEETGCVDVVTSRWGLMAVHELDVALAAARRAMRPNGKLVAALWAEPERVWWHTVPRRVTARYAQLPPIDLDAPGPFRLATLERIQQAFTGAQFSLEHVEEMETSVVEAATSEEMIQWVRTVLAKWALAVPLNKRAAWASDLGRELMDFRVGELFSLSGVTRLVVARR